MFLERLCCSCFDSYDIIFHALLDQGYTESESEQLICNAIEDQYADNIITDLLVDLIMNILKYADKNQPVFIDFTENDEFMIIESQNVISEYVNNMPGSHQGIKTQNILFNSINNTTDSITYKQESDKFTIKVKIDKQLFGG